jgi:hypothetical protein
MQERRSSLQRGQALILVTLGMTVVFVAGAIMVDVGLWLSERRGAQTDADFSALTGAWELIDPAATQADAEDAATANFEANDEQDNAAIANLVVDDSCFGVWDYDAVTVDGEHESRSLFMDLFGIGDAPDIGAHAKACAGAAQGGIGDVLPFEIDTELAPCFDASGDPVFTVLCPIELGAQGSPPDRGILDLSTDGPECSEAGGSGDIEYLIEWGAGGTCLINEIDDCDPNNNGPWYDCVAIQTGNPKKVLDGTNARLLRDGLCDNPAVGGNGDGVDDFWETIRLKTDTGDPFTSIYEAKDCDPTTDGVQKSPRLVTIIVLEEEPSGPSNKGHPIYAFAGMYLAGCAEEGVVVDDVSDLDRYCDTPGAMAPGAPASGLYVQDPRAGLPRPAACHTPTHITPGCPTVTPTPEPVTPTPTAGPATPTPTPAPPGGGPPGHMVLYGQFVNLVTEGSGVGKPNDSTTIFSIALVE